MNRDEIPDHVCQVWRTSPPGLDGLAAILTAYIDGPPCPDDLVAVRDCNGMVWQRSSEPGQWFNCRHNYRTWDQLNADYMPLTLLVERTEQ